MSTTNKYLTLTVVVILISLLTINRVTGEQAIDVNEVTKNNPFARFAANQAPSATPAAESMPINKPEYVVESVTLKFLDAKSLKTSIEPMLSENGKMEPDAKGNTLVICDTNENLTKILAQIHKIDRRPDQIMIEVVLVDVKLNNETEIGVNWDFLTTKNNDKLANDKTIGTSFRQSLGSTPVSSVPLTATTLANATAWNTIGPGSDFSIIYGDIRNVIHTLQQKNNVEIIASPRVMVVSGKEASIEAVEEIPYSNQSDTSNGGALTSTEFKNVGVTLKVGATLTDDKLILLNVSTEQSVQTGSSIVTGGTGATGTPIVDTRKINSSLLLNDKQILVIGGLRRKETQKQTNQLPILGDLPIVGLAFKSTDTIENSSELLILLSPHIYNGEKPSEAQMEKYNEITQRPLLTIPESAERKKEELKREAEKTKAQEKERLKKEKIAKKQTK